MLRVGLTGGIGSGKSTVSARLAALGAFVLDADRVAREVVQPGTPGLAAVFQEFGDGVLDPDGGLDRSALGRKVFDDEAARLRLNAILHPRIAARTAEIAAAAPAGAVVVHDVPLLVENAMGPGYHLVLVVDAPEPVRVARLAAERGLTGDEARQRVRSQAGDQARRDAADVWLDNSGDGDTLLAAVDRLWANRLAPYQANLLAGRVAPRPPQVVLMAPRPEWAEQAVRMIARIERAVGGRVLRVDHIGSTAVPVLAAKDVLDVQVMVDDLVAGERLAADLPAAAGLIRREGRWWDVDVPGGQIDKVLLGAADPARAVNCHVRQRGSPAWREALLLRDWLRAHPEGAREYAELKRRLAASHPGDVETYAEAKTPFIRSVLARAAEWADQTGWVA